MCDRDTRVGARGQSRRHAGHDLEGDSGFAQRESLLAAAAEHERVAALQAHDRLARPRAIDHQGLRLLLRDRRSAALLADEQHLGTRTRAVEGARGDQPVVEDHLGARDQLERPRRQQPRIAGPGTDEVHAPGHAPTGQSSTSSSDIGKCLGLPVANRAPTPTAAAAIRQSAWLSAIPLRA